MSDPRNHPITYLAKKSSFPDGSYRPEAPPEVYLAAALATRLNKKIGSESIRYVAKKAGLSPQTILNILTGSSRLSGERGVWGSFVLVRVLAIVAGEILPSDEEFPDHERR